MKNKKILSNANLLLERSKEKRNYSSFEDKRPYYDAIASGNADAVNDLCTENYEYPTVIFERNATYSEAVEDYRYEACCAAAEFCFVAIRGGMPDMVAYDIRDRYVADIKKAISLPDIFYLYHGMAYDFARRVQFAKINGKFSPKVRRMMTYIEENLRNAISLQMVADASELSRTYASALFAAEVGMPMNEFIMNERIGEAKRMLKANDHTISEISEILQFCSPSYFSKCFREKEGMSPQKYRTGV